MEDNLTHSVLFIDVRQNRVKDSILLCHLFHLLHILRGKLQHLKIAAL